MDNRRAGLERRRDRCRAWKGVIFDLDTIHCHVQRIHVRRDHDRDRLADIAHNGIGEYRLSVDTKLADRPVRRNRVGEPRQFGRAVHADDAGREECLFAGNANDARMGVRTADDPYMEQAWASMVVEVPAATGEQARVFLARYRLPDHAGSNSRSHRSGIISSMPRKVPSPPIR